MNFSFDGIHSPEWLETTGTGGYAGAAVCGANTRRYHGLLVAATRPPVGRVVLLSKLDEEIVAGNKVAELSCNQYSGALHPKGFEYIEKFARKLFPEWIYALPGGIRIKKTIAAIHDENTVVIAYKILEASHPFTMKWLPLVAGRDYHSIKRKNENFNHSFDFSNSILTAKPYGDTPEFYISIPGAGLHHEPNWFSNFEYLVEQYRGLDYIEDLYNHGKFYKEVKEHDQFGIIISDRHPGGRDALQLFEQEKERRQNIINDKRYHNIALKQLALAADQFIVRRMLTNVSPTRGDLEGASVIAGYHWFSDWGRDTMISLPGLCLSTGRYEDAKKILRAFAVHSSEGMLPNRFPDYEGEAVEYNTVDATLWYFIAIEKYLQLTGDKEFVLNELLPVLKEIIDWHFKGTRYNIKADEDGLLYAGEKGQQLTWMDARIGNWVVTPRMGKAVEINALWYNALMIFASLLELNGQPQDAEMVRLSAAKTKENFLPTFWNENKACLYDYVNGSKKDDAIRPNQIFALSLPYPLIDDKEKAESILTVVTEHLYTPVGLRSLSAGHPDYKKHYGGDQYHRDSAYHEGTVWSWLLGAYVDAIMKSEVRSRKSDAAKVIENFLYHLDEACIGSVSEIFDADAPHHPRGCVAQAWGVAEILRVIIDHQLIPRSEENMMQINPAAIE